MFDMNHREALWENSSDRRGFLRGIALGAAGLALGTATSVAKTAAPSGTGMSRVSFATGTERRAMIRQVLQPFEKEIREGIRGKRVVIKPNVVWDGNPLCVTHPDAVRGVLEFLKPFHKGQVIVAESTAGPKGTMFSFDEYGYRSLEREYNARLADLNSDRYRVEWIRGEQGFPNDIKIIDTFLDPDNYIISLPRMKTHDCVLATLSMKNVLMASPLNVPKGHPDFVRNQFEKAKMHQGGALGINYNMFLMAQKVHPSLAIIDGVEGMEGNGPTGGTAVPHGVMVAGLDPVAVDRIGVELMGIEYADIGYLQWCSNAGYGQGDRSKIQIIGSDDPSAHVRKYKLHENIKWQMEWKDGIPAKK
jgi:uncharacterized protein (DUF362 family)